MHPYLCAKLLLESCNLHTLLDLPGGTFTRCGREKRVLFFEKARRPERSGFISSIWTEPRQDQSAERKRLAEFVELQKTKTDSENSGR